MMNANPMVAGLLLGVVAARLLEWVFPEDEIMLKKPKANRTILLSVMSFAVLWGMSASLAHAQTTYSEQFVQGAIYSADPVSRQYDNWFSFRASLPDSGVTAITVKGSRDSVGRTCSDPVSAQQIADAMRAGADVPSGTTLSLDCDGFTWNTGSCSIFPLTPNDLELNVGPSVSMCECTSNTHYTLRPGILNFNWGGIAGSTCVAPTQTMTVVVETIQTGRLDHFLCYKAESAEGEPKFERRTVDLEDQFGATTKTVKKPKFLCTPVAKDGEPVIDPARHLVCYEVKGQDEFQNRNVLVFNQFEDADVGRILTIEKPRILCVPSTNEDLGIAVDDDDDSDSDSDSDDD